MSFAHLKRRRFVLTTVVAIVSAACAATAAVLLTRNHSSAGPIDWNAKDQRSAGGTMFRPQPIGTPYSTGLLIIQNRGGRSITLEGGWLVGRKSGMRLLGFYARKYPDPKNGIVNGDGYSPRSGLPLTGYVVKPGGTLSVVVGVKLTAPGVYAAHGVGLKYTDGNNDYSEVYNLSLILCGPRRGYDSGCDPLTPEETHDS
jgi:hypothetical protein